MKYRFIADPGHGWLEVSREEVNRLGIAAEVSHYSYQYGDKVYLEEDCDLSVFLEAKKAVGEAVELVEVYQENTPVRNYPQYRVEVTT